MSQVAYWNRLHNYTYKAYWIWDAGSLLSIQVAKKLLSHGILFMQGMLEDGKILHCVVATQEEGKQ